MTNGPTTSPPAASMGERGKMLRQFHDAYGVPMRDMPTSDVPELERLLRARLVLEEALEFVEAMGCTVYVPDFMGGMAQVVPSSDMLVQIDPTRDMDLELAADALADTAYVVEGSAVQLGIDLDPVFAEVHRSNMSKLGADGKPIYRTEDGKVLKGPGFRPPDIGRVLRDLGWNDPHCVTQAAP
jgi:predicted HAD superfamily Cof-like phosphohydrolase